MTAQGAWTHRPYDPSAPRAPQPVRPRYDLMDAPALLWRERSLMAAVFLIVFALGLIAAFSMKTSYPASSSVLVRLGQEYVYEPRAGDAGRGAAPDSDQLIQSETSILGAERLRERVIERLGLAEIYPKLGRKYAVASPDEKRILMGQALRAMEQSLKIETAPDTPIIKVSFSHEDPVTAAKVLNTLLEEYLIYRRGVLSGGSTPALDQQRQAFEDRLGQADTAYEQFLNNNRIGDFVAEKASLSQLQAQVEQQKYQTEAQLQDRLARLAALDGQLAHTSPEVGLYRDLSSAASDKLVQLKVQREDMASRYQPGAQPLQELDAQIAQLEAAIGAGRTTGESARRVGVNPVYQTVQTDRIQLAAEVAALGRARSALQQQIEQITDRRIRLASLEPKFQELSLDRDVLQANVRDFTVKAEQSRAAQEIAAASDDNIRIVERATPPTKGKSLKKPVAVLALLFAGFTALCAGLMRTVLRPGLPTARSAGRTLELPVLGSAALKT